MMTELPCTCRIPSSVDLNADSPKALLMENLQLLGWSPIRCHPGVPSPTATAIRSLFSKSSIDPNLHYRSQESGGGSDTLEPKESLELEHARIIETSDSNTADTADTVTISSDYRQVREWCYTLSSIAQNVNRILELPPNLLLVDDDKGNDTNNNNHFHKDESPDKRLDLLRVFYYHAVTQQQQQQQQEQQQQIYGSSPHTDWGSWTVVWQDDVGGLETFCRKCQKWIPVRPAGSTENESNSQNNNTWNCIVHVGDLASLALGNPPGDDFLITPPMVQWPSPHHRVVSPVNNTRTSLVYFAYPPASCSLGQLQMALQHWNPTRGLRLPLSEYYLLRDQSSDALSHDGNNGNNGNSGTFMEQRAMTCYEKIRFLSIREAIQEKWNQVQRGMY